MKNTLILCGRLTKHILRSPDTILSAMIQPIGIMMLFVYVFGGAVASSLPDGINYVSFQLPGILVMAVTYGTMYTSFRLFNDKQKGIFNRFNSMPVSRSSALWAHVLVSVAFSMTSLIIVFGVALLMGFRSGASILEWLALAGILTLLSIAMTWMAVIPGLTAKTIEGASFFAYPIVFLPMFSSAFAPTETMPAGLRAFAENQPMTPIIETLRALLSSEPVGNEIWAALALCAAVLLVSWFIAMKGYKRLI